MMTWAKRLVVRGRMDECPSVFDLLWGRRGDGARSSLARYSITYVSKSTVVIYVMISIIYIKVSSRVLNEGGAARGCTMHRVPRAGQPRRVLQRLRALHLVVARLSYDSIQ